MKRTLLSAALASLLVLTACGGGGEDEEAKSAISDYLMQQQAEEQMIELEKKDADCISEDMVDGIGVEKLKEYGFLNEDGTVNAKAETPEMAKEDAEVLVDSMFDCTEVMDTIADELSSSMGDQSAKVKQCFEDALTEESVRGMLVGTFSGDENAGQELIEPLTKCALGNMEIPEN
ncbi:MAG: hypothetical protein ACOYX5_00420 [Actinomycetota bacterium]